MKRVATTFLPQQWANVLDLRQFAESVVSRFDMPHAYAKLAAAVTSSTTKTLTVQVVNRAGSSIAGRFILRLVSLSGSAIDTHTTFVVSTGVLLQGVATGYRQVMTDSKGVAVLTLTYAGTAGQTRTLVVDCGGDSEETTLQW
jgi:hypothetical protein